MEVIEDRACLNIELAFPKKQSFYRISQRRIPLHTSCSVGQRRVASSYFLQASSSKASLEGEVESGLTLSALSCMPTKIERAVQEIKLGAWT